VIKCFLKNYIKNIAPDIESIIPVIGVYNFESPKFSDLKTPISDYKKYIVQKVVNKITRSLKLSAKIDEVEATKEREKHLQLVAAGRAFNFGIKHELNQYLAGLNPSLFMFFNSKKIRDVVQSDPKLLEMKDSITKCATGITEKVGYIKEGEEKIKLELININDIIKKSAQSIQV